jgi:hypothetical protein
VQYGFKVWKYVEGHVSHPGLLERLERESPPFSLGEYLDVKFNEAPVEDGERHINYQFLLRLVVYLK